MTAKEKLTLKNGARILLLPEEAAEPFAQTLRELSAGRLVPEKVGSVFRGVLRK